MIWLTEIISVKLTPLLEIITTNFSTFSLTMPTSRIWFTYSAYTLRWLRVFRISYRCGWFCNKIVKGEVGNSINAKTYSLCNRKFPFYRSPVKVMRKRNRRLMTKDWRKYLANLKWLDCYLRLINKFIKFV